MTRQEEFQHYLSLPFEQQLDYVNKLHGSRKIDYIISSPHALKLTRRLAEEEVYLTIKEVGEEDALALYQLTNFRQAQFIYDLEWWNREFLAPDKIVFWFSKMLEAHATKLMEWARNSSPESLIAVFQKLIRVHCFDNIDELRGDMPELHFFTLDNLYYIEFMDEEYADIVKNVISLIRERLSDHYYEIMQGVQWSIEPEMEETVADFRRSRLEQKGFRDIHEAMAIYQPIPVSLKKNMLLSDVKPQYIEEHDTSPHYALDVQKKSLFLSQLLHNQPSGPLLNRVRFELVHLSHRLLITDNLKPDYHTLQQTLKKAFNMVNLGLEQLCQQDHDKAVYILDNNFLEHIFRVGYEPIMNLHHRASRLFDGMDQRTADFWLHFLDTPRYDIVKALLKTRPQCCNLARGLNNILQRDFESTPDIEETTAYFEQAGLILKIFKDRLGFSVDLPNMFESAISEALTRDVDWIKLFNTLVINFVTSTGIQLSPLDIEQLPIFYERYFRNSRVHDNQQSRGSETLPDYSRDFRDALIDHGILLTEETSLFLPLQQEAQRTLLEQFDGITLDHGTVPDHRLFPGLWFRTDLDQIY